MSNQNTFMLENNNKIYSEIMQKYHDDNSDHSESDSSLSDEDNVNTHLIQIKHKCEQNLSVVEGDQIVIEQSGCGALAILSENFDEIEDELEEEKEEERIKENEEEKVESVEPEVANILENYDSVQAPKSLSVENSSQVSIKMNSRTKKQQKCSFYRELYVGEQWNIDQLTEQLSNVVDDIKQVPEAMDLYLKYYLKAAQSICSAIERRDLYSQTVTRLLIESPHRQKKADFKRLNLKIPVPILSNMNIQYTMDSVTLSFNKFQPGFLFGIVIGNAKVLELPVMQLESLETKQKTLSLQIDKTFRNIKEDFEFTLKLYFRSTTNGVQQSQTTAEETDNQRKASRKHCLSSSIFRRFQSIRRVHETMVEKDMNVPKGVQSPKLDDSGSNWNWCQGVGKDFSNNPAGFKMIAQLQISGKNLLRTSINLEQHPHRENLFHDKVFANHRTLAYRD